MILRTRTKVTLASRLSRVLVTLRRWIGRDATVIAKRGGIWWELDLTEGIDLSIYLFGRFQGDTIRFYSDVLSPGAVVLDIGANVGSHTLPLARAIGPGGKVYAFEPTGFAFDKLERNLGRNPALAARVVAERVFLTDRSDGAMPPSVFSSWPLGEDEEGDVHPRHRGRSMSVAGAKVSTLDDYVEAAGLASLDLVKLDVDGYERDVLEGGRRTLQRFRPWVVMELAPYVLDEREGSLESIVTLLAEAGYHLRTPRSPAPLPSDGAGLRARIPEGAGVDVVAAPGTTD